jgi:hypothetical protein
MPHSRGHAAFTKDVSDRVLKIAPAVGRDVCNQGHAFGPCSTFVISLSHLVARVRTIFIGACLVADVDCKLTVRSRQQQRPELYNLGYYRASQAHWLIIWPLDIVGIFDN